MGDGIVCRCSGRERSLLAEGGCEISLRAITDRPVRAHLVVVAAPGVDCCSRMVYRDEPVLVEGVFTP